jgi:hypothetical protein
MRNAIHTPLSLLITQPKPTTNTLITDYFDAEHRRPRPHPRVAVDLLVDGLYAGVVRLGALVFSSVSQSLFLPGFVPSSSVFLPYTPPCFSHLRLTSSTHFFLLHLPSSPLLPLHTCVLPVHQLMLRVDNPPTHANLC